MRLDGQMTLGDVNPEYQAFVDKFKPKKTTDDCYTPARVYDAILGWVVREYGIDPEKVIRPFWPGVDYQNESYPEGWTVVDNPPFSILSRICKDYQAAGVRFFLFSPYLTNFSCGRGITHIITASSITYENGAVVDTAFLTNLDEHFEIRGCPELGAIIEAADLEEQKTKKAPPLPKYNYPDEVITPATIGYLAKHGVRIDIPFDECYFIRTLDAQRAAGKSIFGGGYLLSEQKASERAAAERAAAERAAAERAAATRWQLSPQERRIVEGLSRR